MKRYSHLTENERYQIKSLISLGHGVAKTAAHLKRSYSTIKRELARNRGGCGYRPRQAQAMAVARLHRRARSNARRIDQATWDKVEAALNCQFSPEQISGRLKLEEEACVSHESIYRYIYADKRAGGTLWHHLRCQKIRRVRYGAGRNRRSAIPNRVSIDARPAIVAGRCRVGDWEGDTIIGAGQKHAIVSLAERYSRYTVLVKVARRTAEQVTQAIVKSLLALGAPVHTLTFDNGKEFSGHEAIANDLKACCFFADPYASWQRGLNENHNGLVRQYIPKKRSLLCVSPEEIAQIAHRLNHRPRKSLGYCTPHEVLMQSLQSSTHLCTS
ncbi:MAG: IS30 family transposase [Pseudonocardiaceae bacterium]